MKSIIKLCVIISFLSACQKDKPLSSIIECHDNSNWTETSFKAHLIGKWQLFNTYCTFEGKTPLKDKVILEFNANDIVLVIQNGILKEKTAWHLSLYRDPQTNKILVFNIKTDTLVHTFPSYGAMALCDDELSFNTTADDGCDWRYFRVK